MKRAATLLLALLLSLAPTAEAAQSWVKAGSKAVRASVPIRASQNGLIVCTAFVIDNARDYLMTAAHCVDRPAFIGDYLVTIKWFDADLDIAVLHVPGIDRPNIKIGHLPKRGEPAAAFGYGWGLPGGMLRTGVVGNPWMEFPNLTGRWVQFDFPLVPGMSGGPIVDTGGKLIAVVSRSSSLYSLGRSNHLIRHATRAFWS
jgi:S1-C subfamily serine protease